MVSTRTVGSYQATLSIGGVLPVKTVRAVITPRPSVLVCGTPFGVKMFSEGALVVGFTDISGPDGAPRNPAKEAGLRLGDRVICIGDTATDVDACDQVGVTCLSAAWQDGVTEALEQRNPGKVFDRVEACGAYLLEQCATK